MSANTTRSTTLRPATLHAFVVSTLLLGTALAPATLRAATAAPSPIDCGSAVPLTPGETWRDPGAWASGACFTVDVDETGLLVAELLLPATAPGAHLTWLDSDAPVSTRLQQTGTTLVLAAGPGRYRLGVRTDDPAARLGPFRLWIDLAEPAPSLALRNRGAHGEHDSELELEPDPLVALCPDGEVLDPRTGRCRPDTDPAARTAKSASTAPVPSGIRPPGPSGFGTLCQRAVARDTRDDHGDTFTCAAPLTWSTPLQGRLANDWGDDRDVFRFEVESLQPVEIAARVTEGNGELFAELYDGRGQRLERMTGEGAGRDPGIRRIRTLVPGTYFVRLEGRHGAEGRYSLQIGPPR